MQRSGRVLILLGFVLAIMAAAAALFALNNLSARNAAPVVKMKKVVVAQQGIASRARIDAAAVTTMEWPEGSVPPNPIADPSEVVNKLAAAQIVVGQVFVQGMVVDKVIDGARGLASGTGAAYILPDDKVAVAFPIDQISGVASALRDGDRVDVLVSYERAISNTNSSGVTIRRVTQTALQDVEILHIGSWAGAAATDGAAKDAANVTFAVTPQDALVLKFLRETAADVQLSLRAAGNHRIVTTQPVIIEYIDQRFNFNGALTR